MTRHRVVGPCTGQEFEIRRISRIDYMRELGVNAGSALKDLLKAANDPDLERKTVEFYLKRGVVEPKIFFGPENECPEDQIHYADLGDDAALLVRQILLFSGYMPREREENG